MAFSGWNDACDAASDVISHIDDMYGSELVAADRSRGPYYDLQTHRPLVVGRRPKGTGWCHGQYGDHSSRGTPQADLTSSVPGVPEPTVQVAGVLRRAPRRSLQRVGPCPGCLLHSACVSADVAYTQDLPVRAFTQNAELSPRRWVRARRRSRGFTGITGVMADACDRAGIPGTPHVGLGPQLRARPRPAPKPRSAIIESSTGSVAPTTPPTSPNGRVVVPATSTNSRQSRASTPRRLDQEQSNDGQREVGESLAEEILGVPRRRTT